MDMDIYNGELQASHCKNSNSSDANEAKVMKLIISIYISILYQ